jgi:glyoxalase superfamily protein
MNEGGSAPLVELAAITIDCGDPAPMAAFYAAAFAAEVSHADDTGAWIHIGADLLVLVRTVDDYRPPTWPATDIPLQMHFEMWVDDIEEAETRLRELGATTPDFQPLRQHGNLVMLDPAGHPFCIGTRV